MEEHYVNIDMYSMNKSVKMKQTTSLLNKNLQLISFDSRWEEVYLGTVRRDVFSAICPNCISCEPQKIELKVRRTRGNNIVIITAAKWCPLLNCTVLAIGSRYGVHFYDWDGSSLIYEFDFGDHGIGFDDQLATGSMAKGIAAIGSNNIAVGTHTGTILLFQVTYSQDKLSGFLVDTQRHHSKPITELASVRTEKRSKDILASGDENGCIILWCLMEERTLEYMTDTEPTGMAVTCLCLWNRIVPFVVIAAFASGSIQILDEALSILVTISAHGAWITGMDLATQSGLLITISEDSFIKVWKLSRDSDRMIQHQFSKMVETLVTGVKFLNPDGSSFVTSSYDTDKLQFYQM